MRTVAVVCAYCTQELTYVELNDEEQPVKFASRWFDCDCLGRRRVTFQDVHDVINTAACFPTPDGVELVGYAAGGLRLEPWTARFTPRRRRTR